jgi:hypothetical protein
MDEQLTDCADAEYLGCIGYIVYELRRRYRRNQRRVSKGPCHARMAGTHLHMQITEIFKAHRIP